MRAIMRTTLQERINFLVQDWEAYHHDNMSSQKAARTAVDFAGNSEQIDALNHLNKRTTAVIIGEDILRELQISLSYYNSCVDGDEAARCHIADLFNSKNDRYLDLLIDYNLSYDDQLKAEMAGEIEVLKQFIIDVNNAFIYGE